jgi:hypothetical protein
MVCKIDRDECVSNTNYELPVFLHSVILLNKSSKDDVLFNRPSVNAIMFFYYAGFYS